MSFRDSVMSIGLVLMGLIAIVGVILLLSISATVPTELWITLSTIIGGIAGTTIPRRENP